MSKLELESVKLREATLKDVTVDKATFTNVTLDNATLNYFSMRKATGKSIDHSLSNFAEVAFHQASILNLDLQGAQIRNLVIDSTATVTGCHLKGARFVKGIDPTVYGDVDMRDMTITDGLVQGMTINGNDIAQLIKNHGNGNIG